jgi:PAS domain S-box-containing protein
MFLSAIMKKIGIMQFSKRLITLIIGITSIIILIISYLVFEYDISRKELLHTIEEQSSTLVEAMSIAIENSFLINNEIENLLIEKLNQSAMFFSSIEKLDINNHQTLRQYDSTVIDGELIILSEYGEILASNKSFEQGLFVSDEIFTSIEPVLNGKQAWSELGVYPSPLTGKSTYYIARQRSKAVGVILSGYDMTAVTDFRKRIGIGNLIQSIGDNEGIVYIALQDNEGIYSASKDVDELSSFQKDEYLRKASIADSSLSRLSTYKNEEIFEVIKRIRFDDGSFLLTRIGISLDYFHHVQNVSKGRLLIIAISVAGLGAIIIGFVIIRRNLSKLKLEHRKIKTYTGSILDNIADSVLVVDKERKIRLINKAASTFFGLDDTTTAGVDYDLVFPNDELNIQKLFNGFAQSTVQEVEIKVGDSNKSILVSLSVILDESGSIDNIIAVISDLTEQKRMRKMMELREKIHALGELAAGVAHEIRNPLNAISIIVQRFQHEFQPQSDVEEYDKLTTTVRNEVARVNGIINQFLDYAKPPKLRMESADVTMILNDTISLVESQANAKNIIIERDMQYELVTKVDKEKIKQAFLNILLNAIDAIENGGVIKCSAKKKKNFIEIIIEDNGIGIPENIRDKVFNLYFTTKKKGSGLGLSIVHQIISEHGGEISLLKSDESGTAFQIILPN